MQFNLVRDSYKFKYSISNSRDYYSASHYHLAYELLFVISGSGHCQIAGIEYEIAPNTLLVIQPGQVHNVIIDEGPSYERIVLNFPETAISEKRLATLRESKPIYDTGSGFLLRKEIESLTYYLDVIRDEEETIDAIIKELDIILTFLSKVIDNEHSVFVNDELNEITQYINGHLSAVNSIEDICRHANMSKSKIANLFKERLNTTVMNYVRTQKCIRAHYFLSTGKKPKEVCERLAYKDYSTFYRSYMKVFGESPETTHSKAN